MTIKHATDTTLKNEIQNEGLTIVNFWAPWCGPCLMFAPILETFSSEGSHNVKIVKVNVDDSEAMASQFGIMSIPATILFKDGIPVDKRIGVLTLKGLDQLISDHNEFV